MHPFLLITYLGVIVCLFLRLLPNFPAAQKIKTCISLQTLHLALSCPSKALTLQASVNQSWSPSPQRRRNMGAARRKQPPTIPEPLQNPQNLYIVKWWNISTAALPQTFRESAATPNYLLSTKSTSIPRFLLRQLSQAGERPLWSICPK